MIVGRAVATRGRPSVPLHRGRWVDPEDADNEDGSLLLSVCRDIELVYVGDQPGAEVSCPACRVTVPREERDPGPKHSEVLERRQTVLALVQREGLCRQALAGRLGVTVRTVDRDLAELRAEGHDLRPLSEQTSHLPTAKEHEEQTRRRTGGRDMRRHFLKGNYL